MRFDWSQVGKDICLYCIILIAVYFGSYLLFAIFWAVGNSSLILPTLLDMLACLGSDLYITLPVIGACGIITALIRQYIQKSPDEIKNI